MATHGLTLLQIVNRVLRRLRESDVAAYNTTTYSTHITDIINQVKAEIEDAFYWHALRDTFDVSTVAATTSYALTDAGDAIILGVWDTTSGNQLEKGTNAEFDKNFFGAPGGVIASGMPAKYLSAGLDENYDRKFDIWPSPNAVYALKVQAYVPQADLAANGDIPLVPQNVLIEETISRALLEKGEEGVQPPPPGETFINRDLLATAIAREAGHDESEVDWEPV